MRASFLWAILLTSSAVAQGVFLDDLPELARARAERQRPAQLAALEPYLPDLRFDRERSTEIVDAAIEKVAALGDGVVPLLLERLSPTEPTDADRNLAENAARILARLEPETFAEALIDLARGDDPIARHHAIDLLGLVDGPRARETIAAVYPKLTTASDRRAALRAAERQRSPLLVPTAIDRLQAGEEEVRPAAVRYLAATADPMAKAAMVAGFTAETDDRLLDAYFDYFAAVARGDAAVADAIVNAIRADRLEGERLRRAVVELRDIAPEDHRDARIVLRELLEKGANGALGIDTALTLEALGDRRAARTLFDQLDERIKRRRTDPDAYVDRAEAAIAFERWREAIRDYELAIRYTLSQSRRGYYWLQIARCEAHRDSTTRMLRALEESGLGVDTIRREAAKDPAFAKILEKDSVERFLRRLDR